MSLYIDGVLDFSADTTGTSLVDGSHPVNLGLEPHYGGYFDGSLDEFRFYDRPLYASEVSSLHSFESTDRYTEGLVAHHRFEGDYSDSTFYGNSVTETGSLSWAEDRTVWLHGRLILMGVMRFLAILRSSRIFLRPSPLQAAMGLMLTPTNGS